MRDATRLFPIRKATLAAALTALLLAGTAGFLFAGEPASSRSSVERIPELARSASSSALQLRAQQLSQLRVDRWQREGYRGQGLKIAILDTGLRGVDSFLGRVLPAHVQTRSFRADGNLEAKDSQHGILCGEVIHAIAPEAELLFANWDADKPQEFLDAVRWAREQGAQVISCSVIMPSWSDGDGGGSMHERLREILGDGKRLGDVLFFASAGNTAQRHWSGLFKDAGDGYQAWTAAHSDNVLTPWSASEVTVELYAHPGSSYEVKVADRDTGEAVAGARTHEDRCSAAARFTPQSGHTYRVRVRRTGGPGGRFHLVALGGGLEFSTAQGSVAFPADGAEIVAVGAVSSRGERLSYSSCGAEGCCRKPDLVAPVPFPSIWRSKPFAGTSAAAPEAAGLAAVCWSRHPQWTANKVRQAMEKSARDLGPPGYDCETGYGMIRLPDLPANATAKRSR
jgi:hypothetical protein